MQKRFVLVGALGFLVLLAVSAMILVKPRQKAMAENRAAQIKIDGFNASLNEITGNDRLSSAENLKADSEESIKVGDYETAMSERLKMIEWDKSKITNWRTLSFYAIQASALKDIDRIASHLDAATARWFADQLEAQDAELFDYLQVLIGQKTMELNEVDIAAKKHGSWKAMAKELDLSAKEQTALEKFSFVEVKNNIAAVYDKAIADAKLPYSPTKIKPTIVLDPYSKNYATANIANRFLWTRAKTQRVLTILALRSRADRLEKKTANQTLPPDPFGKGQLQSKAGVVYSIGPDGIDNGGIKMPARYQVGAKGDILAPVF